jgi:hypothetical protein
VSALETSTYNAETEEDAKGDAYPDSGRDSGSGIALASTVEIVAAGGGAAVVGAYDLPEGEPWL